MSVSVRETVGASSCPELESIYSLELGENFRPPVIWTVEGGEKVRSEFEKPDVDAGEYWEMARLRSFTDQQNSLMDKIASWAKFPVSLRYRSLCEAINISSYNFNWTASHILGQADVEPESRALHVAGLLDYADRFQWQRIKEIEPTTKKSDHFIYIGNLQQQITEEMAVNDSPHYVTGRVVEKYKNHLDQNMEDLITAVSQTSRGLAAEIASSALRELSGRRGLAYVGAAALSGGLCVAVNQATKTPEP